MNPAHDQQAELPDDPRIFAAVGEYQQELEAGRRPNREEYVNRYPELAEAIGQCLDGLEMVHREVPGRTPKRLASPLGDFQIVRPLARGGMAVVYEAIQLSLGRRVALKVLPFAATFDARQLQRFKNEAQAAALLHHTNIVPIYAVGCERGVHFYAMQLIEGQSLAVAIRQLREKQELAKPQAGNNAAPTNGATSAGGFANTTTDASTALTAGASLTSETFLRRACRLMVQAAEALEHAHQEGVVHRDIKPANLLVDATGKIWVTDFGLAQLQIDHNLTRSGDILGTMRYMSPEQASGRRAALDHRTDVYSLGATFYELLTLEPVVEGETQQEILHQILNEEPRSLRELNRAIPIELETVVLKALSKSPSERYATAAEFAADLQRYLEHQPVLARRPTLLDRVIKWSRRHPAAAIAAVLLLAVVAGASLVSNRLIALEQGRTNEALAREKLRAEEAEQRFQQARRAVDTLFEISEEELSDRPADGARKRILQVVLSYYQEFIEQRRGDPTSQAELAAVQDEVKRILYELNLLQRDMHTRLLASDDVREDLGLTSEQEARLNKLLAGRLPGPPPGETNESEAARRARLVTAAEQHERALAEVLTAAQLERFQQISLQSQRLFAFKDPDIVKTLELSPEQRTQIRQIERETFSRRLRIVPHGPGRPERFDRQRETAAVERVLALLTSRQLERWRQLTGDPFDDLNEESLPGPAPFGPPHPDFTPPRNNRERP